MQDFNRFEIAKELGTRIQKDIPIPPVPQSILDNFTGADKKRKSIPIQETLTADPKVLVAFPNVFNPNYTLPQLGGSAIALPAYSTFSDTRYHGIGELTQYAYDNNISLPKFPLTKVRNEVLYKLLEGQQALRALPETSHLLLVVLDGYRSMKMQAILYNIYRNFVQKENPHCNEARIDAKTQNMVSMPVTDRQKIDQCPPPHSTGGSVDVALFDENKIYSLRRKREQYNVRDAMLNYGSQFDEMMHPVFADKRSETNYFEENTNDLEARKNRRILYHLMDTLGFSNYPLERRHYDYGNQFYAAMKGEKSAKYGFAGGRGDDGTIKEYLKPEMERLFEDRFLFHGTIQPEDVGL